MISGGGDFMQRVGALSNGNRLRVRGMTIFAFVTASAHFALNSLTPG
jgi:hypothetical protein